MWGNCDFLLCEMSMGMKKPLIGSAVGVVLGCWGVWSEWDFVVEVVIVVEEVVF